MPRVLNVNRDPGAPQWQFFMCSLYAKLAQSEQAIEWCGESTASANASMFPFLGLAATNAQAGDDKEAR